MKHTWPLALLAVVLPTIWPFHHLPLITFYNEILALLGWGLWAFALAWTGGNQLKHASPPPPYSPGMTAISVVLWLSAGSALGSAWSNGLSWDLALMSGGMALSAWWILHTAWRSAHQWDVAKLMDMLAWALVCSGVFGLFLGAVQIFMPAWADGELIARAVKAGRAVGNLRQPNHLSTLLVMAACGGIWLARRRKWQAGLSCLFITACIAGVVATASRTGLLGMGLLMLWGWRDRRLPASLRATMLAAPLVYALCWCGLWLWSQAGSQHAFAGQARLHDGSDISSSRFKIWADTLHLIKEQPWTGVGWGQFNLAWTLTELPQRPTAFFDHTHNLVLQWAVELGVPMATLMTVLCIVGFWPLFKTFTQPSTADDKQGIRFATASMLGILALHSMLEYPLWYAYFLLPCAFIWGLGLAASVPTVSQAPKTSTSKITVLISSILPSICIIAGALWCVHDYQSTVAIYAPKADAGPLEQRINVGRSKTWFGYQADYAWVTNPPDANTHLAPAAFHRAVDNLMDARLMIAYAKSLAAHGQIDKARYVAQRLREFRHPLGKEFMAECDKPATSTMPSKPFQCTPPLKRYHWRAVTP